MKNKTNKIKDNVKALLMSEPLLRDDDRKLVSIYWLKETNLKDLPLTYLYMNKVADYTTIVRMRRQLQHEFEELRGEKWRKRYNKQVEVKKELGYGR